MPITKKTIAAIKEILLPPRCTNREMGLLMIKRFLRRSSFNLVELSALTEEEGKRVFAFLDTAFSQDTTKQAMQNIKEEIKNIHE